VGSGGSYSAATLAAYLHELHTGYSARALTPLDSALSNLNWAFSAALVLTARGGNPDILGVFRQLAVSEPYGLATLCTRRDSPLADLASRFSGTRVFDFDLPSGKDGFLATNSLLATCVFLARLYKEALGSSTFLPRQFRELLSKERPEMTNGNLESLWNAQTLITLYSPVTRAAAVDLESKFSEAAIGNLQAVDYRNFAHGRHHWLSRHRDTTGVIAFVADEVEELSSQTLRLIPKQVPTLRIRVHNQGAEPAISALVHAIQIVGMAGTAANMDPGRPRVPSFGRKIYHLNAFRKKPEASITARSMPIVRKSGTTIQALTFRSELVDWEKAYARFCSKLQRARFGGLVLDYDGTLCDERHRFEPLDKRIAKELARLARAGAVIGVATGRGKSVREALQNALPKTVWKQFVVGYYNGGDIAYLKDNDRPDGQPIVDKSLKALAESLKRDPLIQEAATLTFRRPQITIEPKHRMQSEFLWDYVQANVCRMNIPGVMALRSSHSMDILAPSVNKQNVVDHVEKILGKESVFLCIGDRGRWDEVSTDPEQCWNLAPPGTKGLAATLYYFSKLVSTRQGLQLRLTSARTNVSGRKALP
jgi:fructoselysine-6-P-deglycase FrlB-like protein/hydroxymethylpyrimidine pyrophosphatase-like HAD family hydrolase